MPVPKGNVPWNAGTSAGWTDKRGYRWLYVSENGRRRARREHRVIVERHIGRRLEPWEVVHHKDGNPSNNQISNLEVVEFGAARRSIEAFALMREELKAERALKADLIEALRAVVATEMFLPDHPQRQAAYRNARAAIAKATGGQP